MGYKKRTLESAFWTIFANGSSKAATIGGVVVGSTIITLLAISVFAMPIIAIGLIIFVLAGLGGEYGIFLAISLGLIVFPLIAGLILILMLIIFSQLVRVGLDKWIYFSTNDPK